MGLAVIAVFLGSLALLAEEPAFVVASIKPSGPKSVRDFSGGPGSEDPEYYRAIEASLNDLIVQAWNVDYFQISSAAALDRQSFDLVAKVPPHASKEEFRAMLRNLLAERFGLKAHVESRQFAGYEMTVTKTGPKFKEGDSGEPLTAVGWPDLPPGTLSMIASNRLVSGYWLVRLRAQEQPMSKLAKMLKTSGDPPIVDKTGLTGKYSFSLEYVKDAPGATEAPSAPAPASDLRTALREQLGLQLISKKLPFDVVVVEAFNKLPTANSR